MGEVPTGFAESQTNMPQQEIQSTMPPIIPVQEKVSQPEAPKANEVPKKSGAIKKAFEVLHRRIIAPILGR